VLGRSMKPLVIRINMYKNRYGSVEILVSTFGVCVELMPKVPQRSMSLGNMQQKNNGQ
jgi:hypothetical protein